MLIFFQNCQKVCTTEGYSSLKQRPDILSNLVLWLSGVKTLEEIPCLMAECKPVIFGLNIEAFSKIRNPITLANILLLDIRWYVPHSIMCPIFLDIKKNSCVFCTESKNCERPLSGTSWPNCCCFEPPAASFAVTLYLNMMP